MRTPLLALALLVTALPAPAALPSLTAQEQGPSPAQRAARFLEYLRGAPHHARAFEGFLAASAEAGGSLAALEVIASELEAQPDDDALRVLVARLHRARGEPERALEVLAPLDDADPQSALLRAELELELGATEIAASRLALIDASGGALELRRELHTRRAEVFCALDRGQQAAEAVAALGALEAHNVDARLDAGALAERLGLEQAAFAQLDAALAAADDDVPARCRALAARARLFERGANEAPALADWSALDALVGAGHWMRAELEARLVALHTAQGSLELWCAELAQRDDAQGAALHARALVAAERGDEALARLGAAVAAHPEDLDLGRAHVALARERGAREVELAELARMRSAFPDVGSLDLELGMALARAERWAAAAAALEDYAAREPQDARRCARIADELGALGAAARAVDWLERAVERAPLELERVEAHATALEALDRAQECRAALAAHEARCAGSAQRLAALAELFARRENPAARERCLRAALALAQEDGALLEGLAATLDARGAHEEACALERRRLAGLVAADARLESAARLTRRLEAYDLGPVWFERLTLDLEREPGDANAALLLVGMLMQHDRLASAAKVLKSALLARPDDLALARKELELLCERREIAAARTVGERLAVREPQRAAAIWLQLARLHDVPAFRSHVPALLERAAEAARDDAAASLEVGVMAHTLRRQDLALAALENAARRAPADPAPQLALARVRATTGPPEQAAEHLLRAWRRSTPRDRALLARRLKVDLGRAGALEALRSALSARMIEQPADTELVRLVAELALRADDARALVAWAEGAPVWLLRDPQVGLRVGLAEGRAGRLGPAIARVEAALAGGADLDEERRLECVALLARADRRARAIELARGCRDPVTAATSLASELDEAAARELLEGLAAGGTLSAEGWARLGELRAPEDAAAALVAWQQYEELGGGRDWRSALAIASSARSTGDAGLADEASAYLAELAQEVGWVRLRVEQEGRAKAWCEVLLAAARSRPADGRFVALALAATREEGGDPEAGLQLLDDLLARDDGPLPVGHTRASWRRRLLLHERAILRDAPELAQARWMSLSDASARREDWAAEDWARLLWLARRRAEEAAWVEAALAAAGAEPLVVRACAESLEARGERGRALVLVQRATAAGPPRADLASSQAGLDALARRLGLSVARHPSELQLARLDGLYGLPTPDERSPIFTVVGALRARARLGAALGRDDEVRSAIDALEALDPPASPLERALIGLEGGAFARAAPRLAELRDAQRQTLEQVPRSHGRKARGEVWRELVERCRATGHPARAWSLACFAPEPTLELAWTHDAGLAAQTRAELSRRFERSAARGAAAGAEALRGAAMELVELEIALEHWEELAATLERAGAALPDDAWPGDRAAPLAAALGRDEQALELFRAQLEAKRAGRFVPAPPVLTWPGRELSPTLPDALQLEVAVHGNPSRLDLHFAPLAKSAQYRAPEDPLHDHLGLLRLRLEREDLAGAVAAVEDLARDEPDWLGVRALGMARLFERRELGEHAQALYAALYAAAAERGPVPLEVCEPYAQALYAAERSEALDALVEGQLAARRPPPRDLEEWARDWRERIDFGER